VSCYGHKKEVLFVSGKNNVTTTIVPIFTALLRIQLTSFDIADIPFTMHLSLVYILSVLLLAALTVLAFPATNADHGETARDLKLSQRGNVTPDFPHLTRSSPGRYHHPRQTWLR
jgi:hypothetical protein